MAFTLNYHFTKWCNYRCGFCFATFKNSINRLNLLVAQTTLTKVAESGLIDRVNFVGGEPLLYADELLEMVKTCHTLGLKTSIVTNGVLLLDLAPNGRTNLENLAPYLDTIGISIDSLNPETNRRIGRTTSGKNAHPATLDHYRKLCMAIKEMGIRLKINTTINAVNQHEYDITHFVNEVQPDRWKIFQVKPVPGQNDGSIEQFIISDEQFILWHSSARLHLKHDVMVVENNDAMEQSYLMLNPDGLLYSETLHGHKYSSRSLYQCEVSLLELMSEINFLPEKYQGRDGSWYQS